MADLLAHALSRMDPAASSSLRGVLIIAARVVGERLEILLEIADLPVHRVFCPRASATAAGARRVRPELRDVGRDLFLLVREFLGLLLRGLDIALRAIAPGASGFSCACRSIQRRRGRALLSCVPWPPPAASAAPHRASAAPPPADPPLLLALQLFEAPRRLLELVGELALRLSAATSALLLLLRRRGAAVRVLLRRRAVPRLRQARRSAYRCPAARRASHLCWFASLSSSSSNRSARSSESWPRPAATTTRRPGALDFVILFGVLQQLQRALLGLERVLRGLLLQLVFRRLHFGRRLRQRLGSPEPGSTTPTRARSLPTSSSTCARSFACARLRNTTFSRNLSA